MPRLSIETTNLCDARCAFCANAVMRRPREHLDMSIFRKVVDEFLALGGVVIDFNTVIGEPLLDPYLLERARYIKQFPQIRSLGFVTNLQWLHKLDMDDFFNSGINWLGISTALSGREKYLEFFGVDRYIQTLTNLIRLIEEKKRRGSNIFLGISIKPTSEPPGDVARHPDYKMISSLFIQGLVGRLGLHSPYADDWLGSVQLPSYIKKRPLYPRAFRPCGMFYTGLILFSNGNIGVCACRDFEANSELILGNAKNTTLKEAWNGAKLAAIRSDWRRRNKVPDICRRCRNYLY